MNQNLKNLLALLLILGGLGFAGLTIGSFAHANRDIPSGGLNPVALIKGIEGVISSIVLPGLSQPHPDDQTLEDKQAYSRGFFYMGLAIVFTSIAAMLVSSTRRDTVPVPGRRRGA